MVRVEHALIPFSASFDKMVWPKCLGKCSRSAYSVAQLILICATHLPLALADHINFSIRNIFSGLSKTRLAINFREGLESVAVFLFLLG